MRWIRFSAQGRTAFGILEGDTITEVNGCPFGARYSPGCVKDRMAASGFPCAPDLWR